jgi:hypothetical protein
MNFLFHDEGESLVRLARTKVRIAVGGGKERGKKTTANLVADCLRRS